MGNTIKHTDTEVIIEGCKNNDSVMQTKLYYLCYPVIYNTIARYMPDDADRKDVLQLTFIKAFDQIRKLKDTKLLLPWMKRIAVNLAIDKLRTEKRRRLSFEFHLANSPNEDLHESDESEEYFADGISIDEVNEVLEQLPNGFRTVFMLYAIENYSHKEIAQLIGTSESNSKTQFMRAKIAIKNLIKQKMECKKMRS